MKIITFPALPTEDQGILREAAQRLAYSLNKITNPSISAVAIGEKSHYFGNNIFLSHNTLICAETSALASAVAAGDRSITKLYLVIGRANAAPKLVSPCGNCRQWLHDFSRLNGQVIEVLSATSTLDEVMLTDSDELLPGGFKSAGLGRMVGE